MSKSRALNLPTYYEGAVLSKKAIATKCISTVLKPWTLVKTPYLPVTATVSVYIDGWSSQS